MSFQDAGSRGLTKFNVGANLRVEEPLQESRGACVWVNEAALPEGGRRFAAARPPPRAGPSLAAPSFPARPAPAPPPGSSPPPPPLAALARVSEPELIGWSAGGFSYFFLACGRGLGKREGENNLAPSPPRPAMRLSLAKCCRAGDLPSV